MFLFHVKQWEIKARDILLKMCTDKTLMAEVVDTAFYPDILSLWICDCNSKDDIHLNLLLVNEGLATCSNEKEKAPSAGDPNSEELLKAFMTIYKYQASSSPQTNAENNLSQFSMWLNNQLQLLSPNKPVNEPLSIVDPNRLIPNQVVNYAQIPSYGMPNLLQNKMYNAGYQNFVYPSVPSYAYKQMPLYPNNIQNPVSSSVPINVPSMPSAECLTAKHIDAQKTTAISETLKQTQAKSISSHTTTEEDNNESDEEECFTEQDDEQFYQMCEELGYVLRFVLRVKLQFGYKIHIIIFEDLPYATSDEIAQLFWATENGEVLERRLHNKNIVLNTITIRDADCPAIFKQLKSLKVKGVEEKDGTASVVLYPFSDLICILNAFGHPSPTIRSEINHELQRLNLHDPLWQNFLNLNEDNDDEEEEEAAKVGDTDSSKFHRTCAYDLRATLEGMKFKKVKLERQLNDSPNPSIQEELKKLNEQCKMFEQRIIDIDELSHA